MTIVKAGFDITRSPGLARSVACGGNQRAECDERLGRTDGSFSEVLKAAPPARLDAWLSVFCIADVRTRAALVDSAPASRDFVRFLLRIVNAEEEGEAARAKAIVETVDHVIAHGGDAWMELLEHFGVDEWNSPAEARALLAAGVPLEIMRSGDELAIATWLYPERVQGMLEAGAEIGGSAALHFAAAARSVGLTKLLLAAGSSVDHVIDSFPVLHLRKGTALCVAARADAVDVAEALLEAGAAVDPVDVSGRPLRQAPLAIAAENGSFAMVRFLVSKGAKLDVGLNDLYCNPLNCALGSRHYDTAAFLIEVGANFNAKPRRAKSFSGESRAWPPFAFACELIETGRAKAQGLALAALMVECGLDANARTGEDWLGPEKRPIYAAIASGEPQLVSAVIAAGADVRGWVDGDDEDSRGKWKLEFDGEVYMTPLDFAIARGSPEIIAMVSNAL
jgi:ankyrin repeat protein